jgi:5-methyltetrahydropteroyltriglutamate--homocysteine methyltransferase
MKLPEKLLPVTMVGSYPRPRWYTRTSAGRDLRECFMEQNWREEYEDAVKAVLKDQEMAGLDVVSDGEMYEDDLVGAAGWPDYVMARLNGIEGREVRPIPTRVRRSPILQHMYEAWPLPVIARKLTRGPLRFAFLYRLAASMTNRPIKMSFVDPWYITRLEDRCYGSQPGQPAIELERDVADIYNAELRELAAAGCPIYQTDQARFSDPGFLARGEPGWREGVEVFNRMVEGTSGMQIWMHFCWGRPYGQLGTGDVGDFRPMFPRIFENNFHVLNIECGDCLGPEMQLLEQVPRDRSAAIGIINHRVLQVETVEQVADKIRRALRHIEPERLYLTTYCGLGTTLPRTIAFYKLKALADGAELVRAEITGRPPDR